MRQRIETGATVLLVLCALVMTGFSVRREFGSASLRRSQSELIGSTELADWQSLDSLGTRIGPPNARATIVEFIDYECPACREYHEDLDLAFKAAQVRYPNDVALLYVHFPLAIHRFASQAGHAVECANEQGRFSEMQVALFAQQDSFGLRPWGAYAVDASLGDLRRFDLCMLDSASAAKVRGGLARSKKYGLNATPSVMVNGWRFNRPPQLREILDAVDRVMASGSPQ